MAVSGNVQRAMYSKSADVVAYPPTPATGRRTMMDEKLTQLIAQARAAWEAMTPAEKEDMIAAQRRSYVIAEAGFGSDADEAEYRAALASGDKDRIRKCRISALDRMAKAEALLSPEGETP